MNKDKLALKLGHNILDTIAKMQADKKDFGQDLIIPFVLPNRSDEPDFIYQIRLNMPSFSYKISEDEWAHKTMAEYYEWELK